MKINENKNVKLKITVVYIVFVLAGVAIDFCY